MTTTTEPPTARDQAVAPPKSWYQRPKTVAWVLVALTFLVVLTYLGNRDLNFSTDVQPSGTWDWEFFWSLFPDMLNALTVTAMATVYGFLVAVVLGFFLALGRRSKRKWISWPFAAVIEFIRSTPLLVQLLFLYYGLPAFGVTLGPIQTLVIGIGIHYGTYCSEAYRAGINSVGKGQWEATTSLNLSPRTTWLRIILPQAIPNVLPALGNFLVAGFKDAPLGSAVQVTGLLFFAQTIASRAFRPVEPYVLIGVGFLMASLPAAWLVRRLERYISYERT